MKTMTLDDLLKNPLTENDVLAALKAMRKGYQSRINNILRKAVLG